MRTSEEKEKFCKSNSESHVKGTNKIILLFHRDLSLKTTLGHSDLSNR